MGLSGSRKSCSEAKAVQIAGIPDRRGSESGDRGSGTSGPKGLGSFWRTQESSQYHGVSTGRGAPYRQGAERIGKTLKYEFHGPRVLASGSGVPCGNSAIGALGLERPQSRWIDYASR